MADQQNPGPQRKPAQSSHSSKPSGRSPGTKPGPAKQRKASSTKSGLSSDSSTDFIKFGSVLTKPGLGSLAGFLVWKTQAPGLGALENFVLSGYAGSCRNNSDDFIPLDKTMLQSIMNECAGQPIASSLDLDQVSDASNRAMSLAQADNRRREVGFLSQAVIETDFFRTFEEYGRGQGRAYGIYYGRGMHQLTWKATYAECSQAVFGDDRLVKTPDLIANDIEVNIKATAWFWRDAKPFNELSDQEAIDEIIYRLYGGTISSRKPEVRRSVEARRKYYCVIHGILNQRHDEIEGNWP